jgi:hypothetical protein
LRRAGARQHMTVALERVTKKQPALNSIVKGVNLEVAEGKLLAEPGWQLFLDGRSSQAMLGLLVRLRELKKQHPDCLLTPSTGLPTPIRMVREMRLLVSQSGAGRLPSRRSSTGAHR